MASKQSVIELILRGTEESLNQLVKLKEQSRAYGEEIKKTRKQINEFATAGKDTKQLENKVNSLLKAQEKLRKGISDTNKEVRDQNKAFESAKFPKDSIIGMEQEYAKLRKEIRGLSKDARESAGGKELIKQARDIKDAMRTTDESFGDTYKNVGNYQQAIQNALKGQGSFVGNMKAATSTMLTGGIFGAGAMITSKVVGELNEFISTARQVYEESKGVEFTFRRIEKNSDILALSLEKTNGLLSNMEIMKAAVEFKNFGLNLEALPTLLEFVAVRNAQTGKSFEYLRDSLVEGLSKQSKLRIDNLGISASRLNAELKKTPDFTLAVAKIAQEEISKAGNVIAAAETGQRKYNVAIENAKVIFGKWLSEGINPVIGGFANVINNLAKTDEVTETQKEKYDKLIVGAKALFNALGDVDKTLRTSKKDSLEYSTAMQTKSAIIQDINSRYGEYLPNLLSEKASIKEITEAQEILNKELVRKQIIMAFEEEITAAIKKELDARKNLVEINRKEVTGEYKKNISDFTEKGATAGQIQDFKNMQDQMLVIGKQYNKFQVTESVDAQKKITTTYKETAKSLGLNWNSLIKEMNSTSNILSGTGSGTDKDKLIKGSVDFLEKRISDLKQSLESEVKDDKGIKKTLKEIAGYENQLSNVKLKILDTKDALAGGSTNETLDDRIKLLKEIIESKKKISEIDDPEIQQIQLQLDDLQKRAAIIKASTKEIEEMVSKVETPRIKTKYKYDLDRAVEETKARQKAIEEERDYYNKRRELGKQSVEKEKEDNKERLKDLERINERMLDSQKNTLDKAADYSNKHHEEEVNRRIGRDEFIQAALEKTASGIFQIETNLTEQKTNRELDAAQKVYDDKIAKAQGNKALEEAAEKELAQKKAAIEKQAAKKRKEIAYKDAIIQGAIATIAAWKEGGWAVALAALTTAINLAVIASTQYAKGGFTGKAKPGMSSDSSGQKPVGIVHEDEYVANKKNTSRFRPFFEAMEINDDNAMARAAYEQLKNSQTFNRMINNVPPVWSQILFKDNTRNNNAGIEERLDQLNKSNNDLTEKMKNTNHLLESVILTLSENERFLERHGRK